MMPNPNMSTQFRAALRSELPIWVQQGLLSEDSAKQLSNTYQLDHLKQESSNLLSAVIFTIGGILLGGGLISFVAANWEAISTPFKLIFLFAALLGFHILGRWLWEAKHWRRLGHALIFCGCLVFGANIGLLAQIFHVSNNWYSGFGAWALGSLAMAWAFRSWIIGMLVLATSFIWFAGVQSDDHLLTAYLYPLIIAAALLPLAWTIRSRVLYTATLVCLVTAACVLAGWQGSARQLLLTIAAGGVFMWTLGELQRAAGWRAEFAKLTAGFGLGLLAATAYIWSFHILWSPSAFRSLRAHWGILFLMLTVVAAVLLWLRTREDQRWRLGTTGGVLTAGGILCASSLMARSDAANGEFLFTLTTNVAALILGAVIIAASLLEERRPLFWLGSLYLVLLILSRFLEYETSLLAKSAAFLACGIAVIFAGISYEKYLRRNASSADVAPSGEVKRTGGRIFE